MEIIDLAAEHMGQALSIVRHGCEAERQAVPALPPVDEWPDLAGFADNGLGVAAFDGRRMVGFLGAWGPFEHAFGSTDAVGVFSPMHGNGVVGDHRAAGVRPPVPGGGNQMGACRRRQPWHLPVRPR